MQTLGSFTVPQTPSKTTLRLGSVPGSWWVDLRRGLSVETFELVSVIYLEFVPYRIQLPQMVEVCVILFFLMRILYIGCV